jgi:hypothetical protein
MGKGLGALPLAFVALFAFVRCVGDSSSGGKDAGPDVDLTGSEGHACFPNITCDTGLTCISSVCVNLDSGTNDAAPQTDSGDAGGGIGVQNVTHGEAASPSVTFPFDPGTNANRLLVVGVSFAPNGLQAGLTVTFGGNLLQEITAADGSANANNNPTGYNTCRSRIFYMANPTNAATVVVTFSGVAQPMYVAAGAIGLYGVSQTTPLLNGAKLTGTTTAIALPVATAPGHMTLANLCAYSPTVTATAGTQQWLLTTNLVGAGSTIASTSAASTHRWIQSNAYAWAASGVDIVPAP